MGNVRERTGTLDKGVMPSWIGEQGDEKVSFENVAICIADPIPPWTGEPEDDLSPSWNGKAGDLRPSRNGEADSDRRPS